jgi:multidrug transporter EmrE-like cation transporter
MYFLNFKRSFLIISLIYLLTAGVFEIGLTTFLKLLDNSSKLWPTIGTLFFL